MTTKQKTIIVTGASQGIVTVVKRLALFHPPYGDPFRKFLSAAIAG